MINTYTDYINYLRNFNHILVHLNDARKEWELNKISVSTNDHDWFPLSSFDKFEPIKNGLNLSKEDEILVPNIKRLMVDFFLSIDIFHLHTFEMSPLDMITCNPDFKIDDSVLYQKITFEKALNIYSIELMTFMCEHNHIYKVINTWQFNQLKVDLSLPATILTKNENPEIGKTYQKAYDNGWFIQGDIMNKSGINIVDNIQAFHFKHGRFNGSFENILYFDTPETWSKFENNFPNMLISTS